MNTIEYRQGLSNDIQEIWHDLKDFMVSQAGWTLLYTLSDTSSEIRYIFYSEGTTGEHRPLYASWHADGLNINCSAYTYYNDLAGIYTDSMWDYYITSATADPPLSYHFLGDKDGVWFVYYSAGDDEWGNVFIGYFDSFFSHEDEEHYPLCVIGQKYEYYWFDSTRIRAYAPWSLSSGTVWDYDVHSDIYTEGYSYGQPNKRDGSISYSRLVFKNAYEVRGALRHVVGVGGRAMVAPGQWFTVSGTPHKYFVAAYTQDIDAWSAFGPVSVSSGVDGWV